MECVEHSQAFEIGDGGGQKGLEAGLAPASVTGFADTEVLEVVDFSFHFRPSAEQCLGGRLGLGGPGRLGAAVVASDHDGAAAFARRAALRRGQIPQVRASK